ncbi:MAG: PQQ-binding-like beta-propeller repeat protein [Mariniblastus sp.]|nr:PQQ-binding-like beta-propeller repeat protein [Mariniblastus sp.]
MKKSLLTWHLFSGNGFGANRARYLLAVFIFSAGSVFGQPSETTNWPMFRGPQGLAQSQSVGIPLEFDDHTNVQWKVDTPPGHSSPVVWGETIFITGYDDDHLWLLALAKADGSLLWKRDFPKAQDEDFEHLDSCPAAPTCCTDGERVFSYFGRFGLSAHDFKGNLIWEKQFPSDPSAFGTGSSPICHQGKVYLQRDTDSFSGLFCFDAETGRELWMAPRPIVTTSYSTPFIWESDAGTQLIAAGCGTLKGYDLDEGKELWSVGNLPIFICPSPTATEDLLVFGGWTTAHIEKDSMSKNLIEDLKLGERTELTAKDLLSEFDENGDATLAKNELPESRLKDAFRYVDGNRSGLLEAAELTGMLTRDAAKGRNVMVAVRSGGKGEITESHTVWESQRMLPYVASPLIVDGLLYYAKKGGIFSCLELKTGKTVYQKRLKLGGEYYACPIQIGSHIFLGAERGTMLVLKSGREFEIVARNEFPEGIYATPAVSKNQLFLRTQSQLFCIGAD